MGAGRSKGHEEVHCTAVRCSGTAEEAGQSFVPPSPPNPEDKLLSLSTCPR